MIAVCLLFWVFFSSSSLFILVTLSFWVIFIVSKMHIASKALIASKSGLIFFSLLMLLYASSHSSAMIRCLRTIESKLLLFLGSGWLDFVILFSESSSFNLFAKAGFHYTFLCVFWWICDPFFLPMMLLLSLSFLFCWLCKGPCRFLDVGCSPERGFSAVPLIFRSSYLFSASLIICISCFSLFSLWLLSFLSLLFAFGAVLVLLNPLWVFLYSAWEVCTLRLSTFLSYFAGLHCLHPIFYRKFNFWCVIGCAHVCIIPPWLDCCAFVLRIVFRLGWFGFPSWVASRSRLWPAFTLLHSSYCAFYLCWLIIRLRKLYCFYYLPWSCLCFI